MGDAGFTKCSKCQAQIPDGSTFCPQCGQNLADTDNLRQACIADANACESAIRQGYGSRPYIRKNFDRRLSEWKRAAELGVPEAQWLLARCNDEGFGVELNKIHALAWHLRAAEQGILQRKITSVLVIRMGRECPRMRPKQCYGIVKQPSRDMPRSTG